MDPERIAMIRRRQALTRAAGRGIHHALIVSGGDPNRYPRHARLIAAVACARYRLAMERADGHAEHLRLQAREALRRLGLVASARVGAVNATGTDANIARVLALGSTSRRGKSRGR